MLLFLSRVHLSWHGNLLILHSLYDCNATTKITTMYGNFSDYIFSTSKIYFWYVCVSVSVCLCVSVSVCLCPDRRKLLITLNYHHEPFSLPTYIWASEPGTMKHGAFLWPIEQSRLKLDEKREKV